MTWRMQLPVCEASGDVGKAFEEKEKEKEMEETTKKKIWKRLRLSETL